MHNLRCIILMRHLTRDEIFAGKISQNFELSSVHASIDSTLIHHRKYTLRSQNISHKENSNYINYGIK